MMHGIAGILVAFAIEELGAFAFVRGIVRAIHEPVRERRAIVVLIRRAVRRDHQIPSEQPEYGKMATVHKNEAAILA